MSETPCAAAAVLSSRNPGTAVPIPRCSRGAVLLVLVVSMALLTPWVAADANGAQASSAESSNPSKNFLDSWFALSDAMKESQPHWMTPLVTITPRLEQEFRYDQSWQTRAGGIDFGIYGGKGLELIPLPHTEIIIGAPAYQTKLTAGADETGWADESFLVKYRILSANEENGNYILTAFMGMSVPTGSSAFTAREIQFTPTLATGKGWGTREQGFDIQTTLGYTFPTANEARLGKTLVWNTALQAHLFKILWPEVEFNATHFYDGANNGREQVFITGGVIFGRFDLGRRAKLILGLGYQSPISSFNTFGHAWTFSGRVAF